MEEVHWASQDGERCGLCPGDAVSVDLGAKSRAGSQGRGGVGGGGWGERAAWLSLQLAFTWQARAGGLDLMVKTRGSYNSA